MEKTSTYVEKKREYKDKIYGCDISSYGFITVNVKPVCAQEFARKNLVALHFLK